MSFFIVFTLILLAVSAVYLSLIIVFTIGILKLEEPGSSDGNFHTRVTVIIPARNEEANMDDLLEGLAGQNYPVDLCEFILADDQSEDGTFAKAREFSGNHPLFPLKIIRTEEKGDVPSSKKKLIERAINIAAGELILTTDADVRHAPGWIRSFIELYESGETSMILGPVAYAGEKGCLGKFQSLEMISLMGVTAGSCRMGFPLMCNGANLAYKKEAFLECGGYKGNQQFVSGDDMFLLMRIIKKYGRKSVKFLLSPVAVVSTKPQLTLRNFFSQRFRWVSKSRGYTDFRIIFTALSTYFFNLAMLSGFVIGIWNLPVLWTTLILVVSRILLEGPLVMLMAKFLGKEKLISLFPPMDLLYIPYVVITGFLGMILPYQWKGRRVIRGGVVKGELKQSPDPPAA